jgi:hypothetical protein
MKSKIFNYFMSFILMTLVSNVASAIGNDPVKSLSKVAKPMEGSVNIQYDVQMTIFTTIEGGTGDIMELISQVPTIVRKDVNKTYYPDGRFEFKVRNLVPEGEDYLRLQKERTTFTRDGEGGVFEGSGATEKGSTISEIVTTDEVTEVLDKDGKVIDSQPTDPKEREELAQQMREGILFLTCEGFENWLKELKEGGCIIDESSQKDKICITCKNEDGTTTTTVVGMNNRTISSITNTDSSGRPMSVVIYDSECTGNNLPKFRSIVEKFFDYKDTKTTTTTISSIYNRYEAVKN